MENDINISKKEITKTINELKAQIDSTEDVAQITSNEAEELLKNISSLFEKVAVYKNVIRNQEASDRKAVEESSATEKTATDLKDENIHNDTEETNVSDDNLSEEETNEDGINEAENEVLAFPSNQMEENEHIKSESDKEKEESPKIDEDIADSGNDKPNQATDDSGNESKEESVESKNKEILEEKNIEDNQPEETQVHSENIVPELNHEKETEHPVRDETEAELPKKQSDNTESNEEKEINPTTQDKTETKLSETQSDNSETNEEKEIKPTAQDETKAELTETESNNEKDEVIDKNEIDTEKLTEEEISKEPTENKTEKGIYEERKDETQQQLDFAQKMQNSHVEDLTKILSLQEKYLYANELFSGDKEALILALSKLNQAREMREVITMIQNDWAKEYNWESDNKHVINFMHIIERKFDD